MKCQSVPKVNVHQMRVNAKSLYTCTKYASVPVIFLYKMSECTQSACKVHPKLVLQTAQLGADEPVSQAIILASQADKSATSSELLRAA
jgi:hypothetical protein